MGWLTGWQYRRPVTIDNTNNSNDLTDYQVLVVADTQSLIQQGKMQADGDDIRFTDSDGTTLLPYWLEGPINDANTKIWVKVPSIPAQGTKVIYFYYGNPSASSESSIADTFIREIDGAQPVKGSWHMDEGSGGIVYDSSGNGNNGTIYGATWANGRYGNGLRFDGVDDYVEIGGNISPTEQITLSAWVYITGDNGYISQDIIRKSIAHGKGYHLRWRHAGINYLRFYLNINNTWYYVEDTIQNTNYLNGWHYFVGTYDGSQMKLYVDGNLRSSLSVSGPITYDALTVTWLMAEYYDGFLQGYIDEVKIFSRGLTQEEITDLYNHYDYTTPNYAGRVLVRKRIDPEPTTSVGDEETSEVPPIVIVQRRLLIIGV